MGTATTSAEQHLRRPPTRGRLRWVRGLVGAYVIVSALTLAAVVVLRHHPDLVTDAVWGRGSIVLASSLVMLAFTSRTARGSRRAFLRLRIASAVMVVAIAVIVSLPGAFPVWLRIEQGACGLLLLAVVALVNGRRLRDAFASR